MGIIQNLVRRVIPAKETDDMAQSPSALTPEQRAQLIADEEAAKAAEAGTAVVADNETPMPPPAEVVAPVLVPQPDGSILDETTGNVVAPAGSVPVPAEAPAPAAEPTDPGLEAIPPADTPVPAPEAAEAPAAPFPHETDPVVEEGVVPVPAEAGAVAEPGAESVVLETINLDEELDRLDAIAEVLPAVEESVSRVVAASAAKSEEILRLTKSLEESQTATVTAEVDADKMAAFRARLEDYISRLQKLQADLAAAQTV